MAVYIDSNIIANSQRLNLLPVTKKALSNTGYPGCVDNVFKTGLSSIAQAQRLNSPVVKESSVSDFINESPEVRCQAESTLQLFSKNIKEVNVQYGL